MPTYAYRCPKCEHEFEAVEKITARTRARKCPLCGGRATRVISGGAGFLFKGEGFYITDYRSEEYRSKAEAEKDTAAEVKTDTADKSDKAEKPKPEKPARTEKSKRGKKGKKA
jgi:putative FmdB family regulatory protein